MQTKLSVLKTSIFSSMQYAHKAQVNARQIPKKDRPTASENKCYRKTI